MDTLPFTVASKKIKNLIKSLAFLYTSKERDRKTLENGKTTYAYRLVELTL